MRQPACHQRGNENINFTIAVVLRIPFRQVPAVRGRVLLHNTAIDRPRHHRVALHLHHGCLTLLGEHHLLKRADGGLKPKFRPSVSARTLRMRDQQYALLIQPVALAHRAERNTHVSESQRELMETVHIQRHTLQIEALGCQQDVLHHMAEINHLPGIRIDPTGITEALHIDPALQRSCRQCVIRRVRMHLVPVLVAILPQIG